MLAVMLTRVLATGAASVLAGMPGPATCLVVPARATSSSELLPNATVFLKPLFHSFRSTFTGVFNAVCSSLSIGNQHWESIYSLLKMLRNVSKCRRLNVDKLNTFVSGISKLVPIFLHSNTVATTGHMVADEGRTFLYDFSQLLARLSNKVVMTHLCDSVYYNYTIESYRQKE
jgi:hypothetical protein